jgi:hypothetical protein
MQLIKHGITKLADQDIPAADCQYVVKTEAIASLERLAFEAYSGDRTHRPARLWRSWNLMTALNDHGWIFIDPEIFNIVNLSLSYHHWPVDANTRLPVFCQIPSIRYYFKEAASHHQLMLSTYLLPHQSSSGYKKTLDIVNHVVSRFLKSEYQNYFIHGFGIIQQNLRRQAQGTNSEDMKNVTLASSLMLKWEQNNYRLEHMLVDLFTTLTI